MTSTKIIKIHEIVNKPTEIDAFCCVLRAGVVGVLMKFTVRSQPTTTTPTTPAAAASAANSASQYVRYCQRAHEAYHKRKLSKAIRLWSRALDHHQAGKDPDDLHVVLASRSAALLALEKPTEALQDADRVVERRPTWAAGQAKRGDALLALKRYAEASVAFSQALELVILWVPYLDS